VRRDEPVNGQAMRAGEQSDSAAMIPVVVVVRA
jgi:hypothetical protein